MKQRDMQTFAQQDSIADSSQPISSVSPEEQVRLRAYEIYEQRGRHDGFAEQDWLQAESELTGIHRMKAAA